MSQFHLKLKFFFFVGLEEFSAGLLDARGHVVDLENLQTTNPLAYQKRLWLLEESFSVFPGEVCLYSRFGNPNSIFDLRPFLTNRCGIWDSYQEVSFI